jgi:SAM-dependent methyltransferase
MTLAAGDDAVLWDLERLQRARGLTQWMFAQFEPFVRGRILEVGAGIGTFSELLLSCPVSEVVLMEPHGPCVEVLRREFSDRPNVRITDEALPDAPSLAEERDSFDFVLCQNVLEHIEDDVGALEAMARVLCAGGRLGLLVPAHPCLYGKLDEAYDHLRRYTRPVVRSRLEASGFVVDDLYSFNALGIPGWWVQSRRGNAELSPRSLAAYELLLRAWKPLETRWRPPWGLSVIAQALKPA